MTNFSLLELSSNASSNKMYKQGSGAFNVPALPGSGSVTAFATVPHGFASDNLLYQVATNSSVSPGNVILPWAPGDNRVIQYASLDATNLYVYCTSTDSSGLGATAFTVNYTYRILVP